MNYDEFYKGNEYKGSNEHIPFKLEILSNREVVFLDENKKVKEDNQKLRKDEPMEKGTYKKKNVNKEDTSNEKNRFPRKLAE